METQKYFVESQPLSTGQVFIDPLTGVTFGIRQINYDRQAIGSITYPDGITSEIDIANPGQKWSFRYKNREYDIILFELNYLYDTFKVQVREK